MAGLAIDRFAAAAVVHADSPSALQGWLPALREHLRDFESVYTKVHARGSRGLPRGALAALAPATPAWGAAVEQLEVVESGVRFAVRPGAGLSVGLFLDMRDVRAWLRAQSARRQVLNLFAYTCSFGVCAALGGAARVVNVDVSRPYLDWGKVNYRLNDLPIDERDFIFGEAFDWLRRFARRGERFDLVILDPPSFSSTPFAVARDYPRLVAAAAQAVAPAGILLAATNHAGTSDERFDAWLAAGLQSADRYGRLVRRWHEPAVDFPLPAGQQPYLKVRALVLD